MAESIAHIIATATNNSNVGNLMTSQVHQNMLSQRRGYIANVTASVACMCVFADAAFATQSDPTPESTQVGRLVEEIIVTAQKREERLQDVPISVSVLQGGKLDRSSVQGITDALSRVPGVSMFEGGRTTITVRGVSAAGAIFNGSSPTGYYVDSVPFGLVKSAIVPDPNAYDLNRVEVLKGPQGTLYGANSINGVVRILTNDPNLDEFEAKALAAFSSTEGGGDGYRGNMAVNVPIVAGKLAVRAVAGYDRIAGWIDRPAGQDANDADLKNLRVKVGAQPSENLSLIASLWSSRKDYGAPSTSDRDDRSSYTLDESYAEDFDIYGLQMDYLFPAVTLSSKTSYIEFLHQDRVDIADAFGLGFPQAIFTDYSSRIFSEELLLNSVGTGPWVWSLGGFYRDAKDPQLQDISPFGSVLPVPLDWTDSSESFAAFGQVTRKLLDGKFELTAGLRYFEDRVTQQENVHFPDPSGPRGRTRQTFDAVTPRLAVAWHPESDATVYASYSQGFRSGFEQDVLIQSTNPGLPAAQPDKLTNYEVGVKGSALSNRIAYEAAIYYLDWNDVQQAVGVPFGGTYAAAITNAGSASGLGFDVALSTYITDSFEMSAAFSTNDLTFDSDIYSNGEVLFPKGSRLKSSPRYTAGLSAGYHFPLGGSGYTGEISTSANYTSRNGADVLLGAGGTQLSGDNIFVARGSFTVNSQANWGITLFGENITNRRSTVDYDATGGDDRLRRLPPRRIGLQVDYRFGGR